MNFRSLPQIYRSFTEYSTQGQAILVALQGVINTTNMAPCVLNSANDLECTLLNTKCVFRKEIYLHNGGFTEGKLSGFIEVDSELIKLYDIPYDRIGNINNIYDIRDFSIPFIDGFINAFQTYIENKQLPLKL